MRFLYTCKRLGQFSIWLILFIMQREINGYTKQAPTDVSQYFVVIKP